MPCSLLEDEYNVVCICLRYAEIRNTFIKPYYINSSSRIKFTQLMNSDNVKDMKNFASFINHYLTGIICIYSSRQTAITICYGLPSASVFYECILRFVLSDILL